MYLNYLSIEEKGIFMELAYNLVYADGKYDEQERLTIENYCHEMNMDSFYERIGISVDDCIKSLGKSSNESKKIIIFELMALAIVDGDYSTEERKIIKKILDANGIDDEFANSVEQLLYKYIDWQKNMNNLIFESR